MKKIIFICISVFVTCLFLSFNHKAQQEQASIIAQAPKTCPRCGGNGVEWKEITKTCSSCKGRKTLGKQDCFSCGGTGETKNGNKCGHCNGTGKLTKWCNHCSGTGTETATKKVTCSRCNGKGKI